MRELLKSHGLILCGTGSRMVMALAYFLILVNTLSLADYGVFVSLVAAALIIGNTGTYGFLAPTFRAVTEKSDKSNAYVGALVIYGVAWLPLTVAAAVLSHLLFFSHYVSFEATLAVVVGEAVLMRVVDASYNLNIARGRYGTAAIINILAMLPRLIAVGLFYMAVSPVLENWIWYYLTGSAVGALLAVLLFPKVGLRLNRIALLAGLKEALSLEGANFIQSVQMELDKILVLAFAGPEAAGIYGLSMRIIYVVSEPVRSLFPLVAKFFIGNPDEIYSRRNQLLFETGLILASLSAYSGLVVVLAIWPDLLGANVKAGYALFSLLPAVFALKLLPEYHKTVLYGAKKLHLALLITLTLTLTKTALLTVIASQLVFFTAWVVPLNVLFVLLYVQSLLLTWRWAIEPTVPAASRAA